MRGHRDRNRADAVAAFREEILAVHATLGGEFDARIKQLQALKRELDEREQVSRTLEEAEEIRVAAVRSATSIRDEASLLIDDANKRVEIVNKRQDELASLASRLASQEADLKSREVSLAAMREEFNKVKLDATEGISRRSREVEQREAEIARKMNELDDVRRRLDERLKALASV